MGWDHLRYKPKAYRTNGRQAFSVRVLEAGGVDPHEAEVRWYHHFLQLGRGQTLNGCTPGAYPEITPERNAKISAALVGNTYALGNRHSDESRALIGAASKGHPISPKQRAQISAVHKGKTVSAETREKQSRAKRGRVAPVSLMRRGCAECDLVTNPGALGRHCKATGHQVAR